MKGRPLTAAVRVIAQIAGALRPTDRFRFAGLGGLVHIPTGRARRELWRPAGKPALRVVTRRLRGLEPGPGLPGLVRGLVTALRVPALPGRRRRVVVVTDGLVGHEREFVGILDKLPSSDTRVFSVGIGASSNRYLVSEIARAGRGASGVLVPGDDPAMLAAAVAEQLRVPALTAIKISWLGVSVFDTVQAVPDLLRGQGLRLVGRYRRPGRGTGVVKAKVGNKEISYSVPMRLTGEPQNPMLPRLWARARVAELERSSLARPIVRAAAAGEITKLATTYGLVSRFTSLVAIDSAAPNPSERLREIAVPVDVPADLDRNAALEGLQAGIDDERRTSEDADGETAGSVLVGQEIARKSVAASVGIAGGGGFRYGLEAAFGLSDLDLDGNSSVLRVSIAGEQWIDRLGLGAELATLNPLVESSGAIFGFYFRALERGLLVRWLELRLGAGPVLKLFGDGGTQGGVGASASVRFKPRPFGPVGLEARYDRVQLFGNGLDSFNAVTFGLGLSF